MSQAGEIQEAPTVILQARPERRRIRCAPGHRHIDFVLRVDARPAAPPDGRPALNLALAIDRSVSMRGPKIQLAREAAAQVVRALGDTDRIAVVLFHSEVELLQPAAILDARGRTELEQRLRSVEVQYGTALHEGWITSCLELLAPADGANWSASRCLLLTDGQANCGLTDVEQIVAQAATMREARGITTSTFGIGPDYYEHLLAPMATAGGGQFHHLRHPGEIIDTFLGETDALRQMVVSDVHLEIVTADDCLLDVVSAYWTGSSIGEVWQGRGMLPVGSLRTQEERHIVVRCGFPAGKAMQGCHVRARLHWTERGVARTSPWSEVAFEYASDDECNQEPRDMEVMRRVATSHADRVSRLALRAAQHDDLRQALLLLGAVQTRIRQYAGSDPEIRAVLLELQTLERQIESGMLDSMTSKERTYESYRRSSGSEDYRGRQYFT